MDLTRFFIYARKSSEDEDRQMLSIEAQVEELTVFARSHSLKVVRLFEESKSALVPGREIFNDMLRRIEAGEADGILCWSLNRLARNFDEAGRLIGMLQRGTTRSIQTPERAYWPSDNVLTMAVEFGMANQYSRDLSRDIRRGIREKVRRGHFHHKPPLGYITNPKTRNPEPDPKTFLKFKKLFELATTGRFGLTALLSEATKMSLKNSRGKPITLNTIWHLLRNPFYYGPFYHQGELHQGSHKTMISKAQFDDIQRALADRGKPRRGKRQQPKGFLYLNLAKCASCGYSITAERHTKKSGLVFVYYRCTMKSKEFDCKERTFVSEKVMDEEVRRTAELVCLPDEWRDKFLGAVAAWDAGAERAVQQKLSKLREQIGAIKKKLDRLNTAYADGGLELAEFKELKNPLVAAKAGLEQKTLDMHRANLNRLEPIKQWILEANQAKNTCIEGNPQKLKELLRNVGSNRVLRSKTLAVEFKKPWNSLVETVLAVRSTEDVAEQNSLWWSRGESNP
jgi:site-specific DNA recombinase